MTTTPDSLSPFELRKLAGIVRADCSLAECHGLLSAVVTAPSMLPPRIWYPQLADETHVFADPAQAQEGLALLMRFYNGIAATLGDEGFVPYGYPEPQSVAQWCRGFVRGAQLDARWCADKVGTTYLTPMAVLAESFADPATPIASYREALPDLIASLYDYWTSKRRPATLKSPLPPPQPARAAAAATPRKNKVGPNEPCACDSGRKYKKCCGLSRPNV